MSDQPQLPENQVNNISIIDSAGLSDVKTQWDQQSAVA